MGDGWMHFRMGMESIAWHRCMEFLLADIKLSASNTLFYSTLLAGTFTGREGKEGKDIYEFHLFHWMDSLLQFIYLFHLFYFQIWVDDFTIHMDGWAYRRSSNIQTFC